MAESRRAEIAAEIQRDLRVVTGEDHRLICLGNVILARLTLDPDTNRWQLERRTKWSASPSELEQSEVELAEAWAEQEAASWYAMEWETYEKRGLE